MRRSAAIVALVLLTLSLVLGSSTVSAKPNTGNNDNVKKCQGTGYLDWARDGDASTAFTSKKACVSYAAMGGTLTPYVPYVPDPSDLSAGCALFASLETEPRYSLEATYPFLVGERLTLVATNPDAGLTGVQLSINNVVVDGPDAFPAELSYDIPTNGTYAVTFIVLGESGNALMDPGCSRL